MISILHRLFNGYRKYLAALIFIVIVGVYGFISIKYVWYATVWGPYDELPHVDYIDRIAFEKRFPKDGELISDRTHKFHLDLKTLNGPGYDGTKEGLGPIGYSYEAHQPPVYYFVMALPYKWIMEKDWSPTLKVRWIRMCSFLLHLLGILMVLPVFIQLKKLFPDKLDMSFGYILLTCVWLTSMNLRFGLGNDHLSMLLINSSLYFLIKAWRKNRMWNALICLAIASLSFFTKYTNLVAVGVIGLLVILLHIKKIEPNRKWLFFLIYIPLLSIPVYFAYKISIHGMNNMFDNKHTQSIFALIPAGLFKYKTFLELMSIDFMSFYYLMIFYKWRFQAMLFIFIFGYSTYLLTIKNNLTQRPYWTIAILTNTLLFIALFILNKYVCCIVWFSFRLYSGYMIFIWFAILGIFSIHNWKTRYINILILLALLYPGISYLIEWG